MNVDKITPVMVVIGIVTFVVTFYLSFTFITKDQQKEEIDYKSYIYSSIPSIVVSIIVVYGYETYKPKNKERLTEPYYD